MTTTVDIGVRPAYLADQRQLAGLMHSSPHVHRHLDWRHPLDWIGSPPFYVLESQGQLAAALACPPDPPSIAWVRLFIASGKAPLEEAWQRLWEAARLDLSHKGSFLVAAIVLQEWFNALLLASGFSSRQSIVMLERQGEPLLETAGPAGVSIRPMRPNDLPAVAEVDAAAFDPLWQNSLPTFEQAYLQAALTAVAEMEGRVIGYQISTRNPLGAHLARLAVRPEAQGGGIGYALIADLVRQAAGYGITHLTVNTQSDNAASLRLYKRTGFRETGERYPVYQLAVP
jgi:ribosomal protein S18 acetylase RimI-like enzyme